MAPANLSIEERAAKAGPPPTWGADSHKAFEPPMEYFLNFPRHAPALFSTNNGTRPRRSLDQFLAPRSIFPWDASQIFAAANTLRRYFFPLFKYIPKPRSYGDLYHYWDAYDLWHMGAYNLWNVLNHLHSETEKEMPALITETRTCIEEWVSTLLQIPACRSKLMAWDPDTDDSPLSVFDGEELIDLDGMENFWLPLVENALKSAQYDLLRNKYVPPAPTRRPNAPHPETGFDNNHGYGGTVWSFHTLPAGPVGPPVPGDNFNLSITPKKGQPSKDRMSTKPTNGICVLDGTSATATKKAFSATTAVGPGVTTQPTGLPGMQPPSTSLHSIQETSETSKSRWASSIHQNGHQSKLIPPTASSRNTSAPTPSPMPGRPGSVPSRTGSQEARVYSGNQPPMGEKTGVPAVTAQTTQPAPGTQVPQGGPPHMPNYPLSLQPYGQQPNMSHSPRMEPGRWAQAPYWQVPFQFPMPGTIPPPGQQPQSHDVVSNETRESMKQFTPTRPMPAGPRGPMHVRNPSPVVRNTNIQKGRDQSGVLPARGLPSSGPRFPPHIQGQVSRSGPSSHPTPMEDRRVSALPMGSRGPPHVPMACEPVFYHNPKGPKSYHGQTMQHGNAKDSMYNPQNRSTNPGFDSRQGLDHHASDSRQEPQAGNLPTHGKGLSSQTAPGPSNRGRGDTVSSSRSIPQDPSCLNWERWTGRVPRGEHAYDPCPCRFCKAKDHSIYLSGFRREDIETRGAQQTIWKEFSKYGVIEDLALLPKYNNCSVTIRYREQASVFRALEDGDRKAFDFCNRPIRVSHPWGSQFYVPPQFNNRMLAQPGTLSHQSVRSVSEQSARQAGSPLAAHSTAAPGVSDVLDHMDNDVNRHISPPLHGSHDQAAAKPRSAEVSPKDIDVPKRDTASGEESSDVLLTKIQELVSARSSRAGSLSQNDNQAATGGVTLPNREPYGSSDEKEIDHGTVIRRPRKGKHGALPTAWNQQSGSDVNESTSVTRNTSSRSLVADYTTTPDLPQKSKSAKSKDRGKKNAPPEQQEASTPPIQTNEDTVVESMKQPSEDQKGAGRSSLNPMGFDLHGSPYRGSLTHARDSSSFMKHSLAPGSTGSRPEYDQQMRVSQQCPPVSQPGQQYGSLVVKKQRGLQDHEGQPSGISSSSQKPSYSATPGDYGPPLGYSTFGLPYPSPPKTSAIPGAAQPREEQRPFAEQDDIVGHNKLSYGSGHVYHRESSIPFPPYVEPPSVQPSAVVPSISQSKPARKQGGKKKRLNPEAKEFVAPTSVSSEPTTAIAPSEAREVTAVPTSPTSKGLKSRPATPASPGESNVPVSSSNQPAVPLDPAKDDVSEASSRTMTVGDDVAKEEDCKPVDTPSVAEKAKGNALDEGNGPKVSEEPAIKPTAESQPTLESSQPKDSEKPTQQPVGKPTAGLQDAAAEGSKRKEAKQGKQWPKNKQFKKGHKRQEARGDINQSWRKSDQKSNQDPIAQATEVNDAKETTSTAPSASGERGSGSNKDQGQDHLAAVAGAKEQDRSSCAEGIPLQEERIPTKATEKTAEKAAVSVEHDPSTGSEPKVKTQNQAQSATVQSDATEQRDTTRDTHSTDTRHSSGNEKRAWSVAVPLVAPRRFGKAVEPPKTKSRAGSKTEAPAVTGAEGNSQEEPSQRTTGKELSKNGNTPKKHKKPTANTKEEPSSMQAQPPRYVPGANWVEEPKDKKGSKKPNTAQSVKKNPPTHKGEASPEKSKDSASAPSGLTAQSAPSKTEPQASEKGQIATDKAGDSTIGSTLATNTTSDTPSQKDDEGLQTKAQAVDIAGPSTAPTPAAGPSNPAVSTTQLSKAQKNRSKAKAAARKKALAEKAPTAEPAAASTAEPAPTHNNGAGTTAAEKAGQHPAKQSDTPAKPPGRSAPAPVTTPSSAPKDGPEPLAPAPKETSPKQPGHAPKKTKGGKDDGGSPETLLEGEERKGG